MQKSTTNKIEKALIKYYNYFNKENWVSAKNILLDLLKNGKKGFWIYSCISACYYEMKDYKHALKFSKLAYKTNPNSPLVLWDYAGVLIMLNKEIEGIKLYEKILYKSAFQIGKTETTEGIKWANSLLNDCRFKIGLAYFRIGKDANAKKYFLEHLKYRKKGLPSLITKNQVLNYIKRLDD